MSENWGKPDFSIPLERGGDFHRTQDHWTVRLPGDLTAHMGKLEMERMIDYWREGRTPWTFKGF